MSPQGHSISRNVNPVILRVPGPQWTTGATIWIMHKWQVGLSHCKPFWSHWALRATIWTTCRTRPFLSFWVLSEPREHQRHIGPAILCVLGPQWAVGATVWTRGKSMSLQVFWVSSEQQEPLYEPHACLAISRYSASPVSHRSHYMNPMYSYLYTGILDPQLPHIPIYHHHVHLAIPTLSGSPVSHRSH